MAMTSSRPFIVRALYDWIIENECTPYVLVNALAENVEVPQQYVKNGQIVLNVSPIAVMDLHIDSDALHFNGRFGGVPMDIYVPMVAVMGIYARENGQGMIFEMDDPTSKPPTPTGTDGGGPKLVDSGGSDDDAASKKKPGLRVVK